MTHPDPCIEEVMSSFYEKYSDVTSLETKADGSFSVNYDGYEIRDFIRTALEAQKAATKTQRIKDIEEIEAVLKERLDEPSFGWNEEVRGYIAGLRFVCELLTSRKAAIEEV